MKITSIGTVAGGQDGAIFNGMLFRFDANGVCRVFELATLKAIGEFVLDKAEKIIPHSNAVVFGREYFSPEDEFPLIYTNVYNNCAEKEETHCGVCCVYRLQRNAEGFTTTLVQTVKIGFSDERGLWRSEDVDDVRPWGNFVVDVQNGIYYAFVMRDGDRKTRYFSFKLPTLADGENVVLTEDDVLDHFDVPYHNYLQGACFHDGRIYEVEGFNEKIRPALRIIDPARREQVFHLDFYEVGAVCEAELIDFDKDRCIYGDNKGNLYELSI